MVPPSGAVAPVYVTATDGPDPDAMTPFAAPSVLALASAMPVPPGVKNAEAAATKPTAIIAPAQAASDHARSPGARRIAACLSNRRILLSPERKGVGSATGSGPAALRPPVSS
jgi:hypothetical protein